LAKKTSVAVEEGLPYQYPMMQQTVPQILSGIDGLQTIVHSDFRILT